MILNGYSVDSMGRLEAAPSTMALTSPTLDDLARKKAEVETQIAISSLVVSTMLAAWALTRNPIRWGWGTWGLMGVAGGIYRLTLKK